MSDTIARIVEKFTMNIDGPEPGRDSWFLDYVLRSPKQAGKHLTAGWLAMNSLKEVYRKEDDITSCFETFGGMGAQALMAERLFNLKSHIVREFSMEAVDHLERVLPKTVHVGRADAYRHETVRADLVILDFGDLTVWGTRDGENKRLLLDQVFAKEPKAVVLTDIACRYLHLHRERYETLLGPGTCDSYESYLEALAGRLWDLYGYRLHVGFMDRWSTVMSLVPSNIDSADLFVDTPDSPVGLELF